MIDQERMRQEVLGYWPSHDAGHGPHEWAIILATIMGKVAAAVWEHEDESYRQYCDRFDVQLTKLAAVAVAAMEVHQQLWRNETDQIIPRAAGGPGWDDRDMVRVARMLRSAVSCLEYVERLQPAVSGYGVRQDIIASATTLLEELDGKKTDAGASGL